MPATLMLSGRPQPPHLSELLTLAASVQAGKSGAEPNYSHIFMRLTTGRPASLIRPNSGTLY